MMFGGMTIGTVSDGVSFCDGAVACVALGFAGDDQGFHGGLGGSTGGNRRLRVPS